MRLAHLADTHLGYGHEWRAGPEARSNVLEADAATGFRIAVDAIIAARPDAVIHAGDLFHNRRPSNACVLFTFQQFRRLREALPDAPIVLIGGNHDTAPNAHTGSPFAILAEIGVVVADLRVERVTVPGLTITAVPSAALHSSDKSWLEPVGDGATVLVAHGLVAGLAPGREGGTLVPAAVAETEAWSYVALGDWHQTKQVGPRAWYPGSTGYTSSDIWRELKTPKAWLLVNLEAGTVEPQRIPDPRPIYDLDPVYADGMTPEDVNRAMADAIGQVPDLTGAVVRLKVFGIPRAITRQLDHPTIRAWKREALHLHLVYEPPERHGVNSPATVGQRQTLEEVVRHHLATRELPAGMDQDAFVRAGLALFSDDEYCGMRAQAEAGAA